MSRRGLHARVALAALAAAVAAGAGGCFETGPLGASAGDDTAVGPGPDTVAPPPDTGGPGPDTATPPPDTSSPGPACVTPADCAPHQPADPCDGRLDCVGYACVLDPATVVTCPPSGDPCVESACDPVSLTCEVRSVCGCEPLAKPLICSQPYSFALSDPGATQALDGYACAAGGDTAGLEHVLRFTPGESGGVQIAVTGGSPGGLLVLGGGVDAGCDASACLAAGVDTVLFQAVGGATYAVVVEHGPGGVGKVDLQATCGLSAETSCQDGVDDDGNGLTDCEDPLCAPLLVCAPTSEVQCDDEVDDDGDLLTDCEDPDCDFVSPCIQSCSPSPSPPAGCTFSQGISTGGGKALSTDYACDATPADGKEIVYRFDAKKAEVVTVTLSGPAALGLYVLEEEGFGCTPKSCKHFAQAAPAGTGSVTFTAAAGERWYFAVDQPAGLEGTFQIDVSCAE